MTERFHYLFSCLLVPLKLPFDAYFDRVYVSLDQCVAEFIFKGEGKLCMLLVMSYVHIEKRATPLKYACAQLKNRILVPAYLPRLLPIVPI